MEEIVRKHVPWQKAIANRGIKDLKNVHLDIWSPGSAVPKKAIGKRFLRVLAFYRGKGINPYGRPIEGVVAVVDLTSGRVTELLDEEIIAISPESGDFFDPKIRGARKAPLKPLITSQPKGPSFSIRGHEVRWQNWRFRYALHPREGLVLHTVGYNDKCKVRPILHRASLSEMVVPYGDTAAAWNWRSAFDQGEYGLGRSAHTLEKGKDVPENAVLVDGIFANDLGKPYVHKSGVAVFERNGGLLWKHLDEISGKVIARRARELVIGYIATVGNYDYGVNWVFRQDGALEVQTNLTGILLAKGVASNQCAACKQIDAMRKKKWPLTSFRHAYRGPALRDLSGQERGGAKSPAHTQLPSGLCG